MSQKNEYDNVVLPLFEKPFHQRVAESWEAFSKGEAKIRQLITERADSDVIMEQLVTLLSPAFQKVYAEVGFNGEKYDLILNLDGDWSRLFPLVYFRQQAPKEVLEHWNISVGRQSREQALPDSRIYIWGDTVFAKDVRVWLTWTGQEAKVSVYCEKMLPLLQERKGEAYWIAYTMLDYAIGELDEMKYIGEVELLDGPCDGDALTLMQLLPAFMEQLSLSKQELYDAERYCQLYAGYQMKPMEDADDGLRRDVFAGSSCFISLLNDFWNAETRIMDVFHKDGIAAGYFYYPLFGFQGENRGAQILDFRDDITARIEELAGSNAFTFIGGATGIFYGYIDFIAWDLNAVIDAAISIFKKSGIEWAAFHSFRQDVDGVPLV